MSFLVVNHSKVERGYFVYAATGDPLPGSGGIYEADSAPVDDATAIIAMPNPGYRFNEWMGVLGKSGQSSAYLELMPGYPAASAGALFGVADPPDSTNPVVPTPPNPSVDGLGHPSDPSPLAGGLSAAWVGVIPYNSVFYTVQVEGGQIWILKSEDLLNGNGATWAIVGGGCPVVPYYPHIGGTPWFDGDHTITVAAMTTGGYVGLCDFDLSTETWGAGYGYLAASGMLAVYALYKRPDGSFLLIGEQNGSNVLPAAVYASGAWGAPFEIAANMLALTGCPTNPNTNAPKSCMDASGNVYVFWQLEGYTVLPDSSSAGPQSAWYGRAFYQRVAADDSTPAGDGNFYDFPGQDIAVDAGGTFPAAKDGDLAWNTTKRNLTGGQTFTDRGGDCFGKPALVGSSIFIPIRRKIPGTTPFVNPHTDEQLYTYCTLYEGDGLPAPVWTELTTGCDPAPPATSTNKCDAVGNIIATENLLWVLYLYSNLGTTDHTDDNTAAQSCVRLCCCAVVDGVPQFNWIGYTIYDRDAAVIAFPDASLYKYVFDAILSMVETTPVVMASYAGGSCIE